MPVLVMDNDQLDAHSKQKNKERCQALQEEPHHCSNERSLKRVSLQPVIDDRLNAFVNAEDIVDLVNT